MTALATSRTATTAVARCCIAGQQVHRGKTLEPASMLLGTHMTCQEGGQVTRLPTCMRAAVDRWTDPGGPSTPHTEAPHGSLLLSTAVPANGRHSEPGGPSSPLRRPSSPMWSSPVPPRESGEPPTSPMGPSQGAHRGQQRPHRPGRPGSPQRGPFRCWLHLWSTPLCIPAVLLAACPVSCREADNWLLSWDSNAEIQPASSLDPLFPSQLSLTQPREPVPSEPFSALRPRATQCCMTPSWLLTPYLAAVQHASGDWGGGVCCEWMLWDANGVWLVMVCLYGNSGTCLDKHSSVAIRMRWQLT